MRHYSIRNFLITDDASPDGKKKNSSKGMSQMFIGLVIGVLGVTVLLLVVTILVMYRKNKQKVFNKHSIFKSPLSAATHNGMTGPTGMGVGMTPTSHMLRDLQGGMGGGTSGNGSTTNTGSSNGGPGKVRFLELLHTHLSFCIKLKHLLNSNNFIF